jgi:hypothetical protein
MESVGEFSSDERVTLELATLVRESGSLHPLMAQLRGEKVGPEHARAVLLLLGELDIDLLVQIVLDRVMSICGEECATADGITRGERWDSNPRPPGPQPGALPAELRPPCRGLNLAAGRGRWRP